MATFEKKELKKKSENISDWYTDVVLRAELADYGPARGSMVIRPYGYSIWEKVQEILNKRMKEEEVQNAYFPLFIPYSLLNREKEHVEGFSPELALVTKGGGEDLSEPLVVRPTSETIMYEMYGKWIKSYKDLPLKINQWNNVVRWEKRTYLFLRTSEFLWQEGHCAHATHEDDLSMVHKALEWYREVYEDYFAIPVISGQKSESEKFAGAVATFSVEALMPDGKALQGATSHDLGQNFSKAQNISFQTKEGSNEYVWQNSWGFTTRSLGALFLVHGDDDGVIIPPKVAPIQVVIVPIKCEDESQVTYASEIKEELQKHDIRVKVDLRDTTSPGRKYNDWEVKGVPVRFEIGGNEVSGKTITVSRRDTHQKVEIKRDDLIPEIKKLLKQIQDSLFEKAKTFMDSNTHEVNSYEEFKEIMETKRGFIKAHWCGDPVCEAKIKEETKATTRNKPLVSNDSHGKCIYCGKEATSVWYFAQAY